jgi:uncharacterized lipoprotein
MRIRMLIPVVAILGLAACSDNANQTGSTNTGSGSSTTTSAPPSNPTTPPPASSTAPGGTTTPARP